jgi:hypothetical protein
VEADDFHQSNTGPEFLKTRFSERPEPKQSFWDSARGHDWTKPSY